MNPKHKFDQPSFTTVGTVQDLTMGGYYNDYDSPGVRHSKKVRPAKKAAKKKAKKKAKPARKGAKKR